MVASSMRSTSESFTKSGVSTTACKVSACARAVEAESRATATSRLCQICSAVRSGGIFRRVSTRRL